MNLRSSPHLQGPSFSTRQIMLLVCLACVPGLLTQIYSFGGGTLVQIMLCVSCAAICEAGVNKLRNRPALGSLSDGSFLVTALLLGLALPPSLPWALTLLGCAFGMLFGKLLYGGLGFNPFNPAMVAYAFLLVSFPKEMSTWLPVADWSSLEPFWQPMMAILSPQPVIDGVSSATPLDVLRTQSGLTLEERYATEIGLDHNGGAGWLWVNMAFLFGGLLLVVLRVITWHIPISMMMSLGFLAMFFMNGMGSESNGTPMYHLFSGATMLGAFFIATDPVSAATSTRGKIIYGAGIGALIYWLRTESAYPDSIAFAVLLMNMAVPLIDVYTRPRSYGHTQRQKGLKHEAKK